MSNNGHKRPFGPHGEGCTCGQEGEHEHDEQASEQEIEEAIEGIEVSTDHEGSFAMLRRTPHETVFGVVAEAYARHFTMALEVCIMDGCALDARQISHFFSAMMQAHAQAKGTASIVEERYRELREAAESAQRAREKAEAAETNLENVADLFSREPRGSES